MNQNHSKDSIQQAVLDKIRAGTVRRRPRAAFVLRVIATATVSVLLLVISALVISFIVFSLRESGEQFLLGFGLRGIEVFFILFPWFFAGLAIALILLLEWLLQGFKFGYRIPLLNIFSGIVGVSLVLGILISFTPLHATLLGFADKGQLPLVGDTYEHIFDHHEDQGVFRGRVISTSQDSFMLQHNDNDRDRDDGTFTILIAPGSTVAMPHVGDAVLVFGNPEQGAITAEYVQVLSSSSWMK